jgi:hypothetical protein
MSKRCEVCGKGVSARRRFCSRQCAGKGLQPYRSEHFRKVGAKRRAKAQELLAKPVYVCRRCHEEKPNTSEFFRRDKSNGVGRICKVCQARRSKESNPNGNREAHLRHAYGMTLEEYHSRIAQQGGVCPICLKREPITVDHDHVDGHVRAIVCYGCNTALGQLFDDPIVVDRAAQYIRDGGVPFPS